MEIVNRKPPFYDRIVEAFGERSETTVYTFGDTIYSPGARELPADLIVHENVHRKRQGDAPQVWWDRYLVDADFRLAEEMAAYREQYRALKTWVKDRNALTRQLVAIAGMLAGPMYGRVTSFSEAMAAIKGKN